MNPVPRRFRVAALIGLATPALALAQSRFDNTAIPLEFLETSPWTVSAGARINTDSARVNFGQLGAVQSFRSAPPAGEGDRVDRIYDNGGVGVDNYRPDQLYALPAGVNYTDAPDKLAPYAIAPDANGRYEGRFVDDAGNEDFFGDFLAYQAGRSRNWAANSESQISGDQLALSLFRAESSGGTAVSDAAASGGMEVSVSRRLWRFGRRAEIGFSALFALNDIDAGTNGTVLADLITTTDYYHLYGTPTERANDTWGGPDIENNIERTTPVSSLPFDRQIVRTANGATITGSWKINGAYYVVRAGPILRFFVTDKLAFAFETGLAAAFVGTDYEVREVMEVVGVTNPIAVVEESEDSAVLTGFYGSGSVEYWMTDRTNAYAGAAYEALDSYQQSVGGRTADIDIGSTITVRLGLTTRF